ncbi:methionyl-tRNA formyltransferase [Diaminobutyricimonas sp. TR449]|uniref:methionyl-tRNA formyltransferase n=1 Tax=Diaminobutyricimonas sp. TR449 TaxID=2708076 RepID=UPI00141ED63A|nr:methionyl-tRNA formyltransferase [Diaminobutyricimonas sp. TR449]
MTSLRIVFAGSPNAAVPSLQRLARSEHEIAAVITRDDSPQGRKRVLTPTPVADAAEALALPVIKANRLNAEVTAQIEAIAPDLGVIVAYGGLVREPLLSLPRLGWVNLHFSLLPRWRGAAPVQRAIIAGDELTGAAVFQLVEELDAGPVYGTMTQPIGRHQTAGHLLDSLADSGAELLAGVVDALGNGTARGDEQVGDVTVAPKLALDDGRLDFTEPAAVVYNRLRGVTPEPGAFADVEGTRLKIIEAGIAHDAMPIEPGSLELVGRRVLIGTADRPLELVRVHPAGKKPMDAAAWWRGRQATR